VSGRTSAALAHAMQQVYTGVIPRRAALQAGIAVSTMYRAAAYKAWKKNQKGSGNK
jgi:hypothetical protein